MVRKAKQGVLGGSMPPTYLESLFTTLSALGALATAELLKAKLALLSLSTLFVHLLLGLERVHPYRYRASFTVVKKNAWICADSFIQFSLYAFSFGIFQPGFRFFRLA